jgi:spore maturation protein CgeB
METRRPRVLVIDPGASWSTADVCAGLVHGLKATDTIDVSLYRLSSRIDHAHRFLNSAWRRKAANLTKLSKSPEPSIATTALQGLAAHAADKPTKADVLYQAGVGAIEMALNTMPDAVLIVSAMYFHPNLIAMLKRAGFKVFVLFTESPYDLAKEVGLAKGIADTRIDGAWTNEKSVVPAFRAVLPRTGYLQHAWHPERHLPGPQPGDDQVPAHDVVFVGSAFQERIEWFEAIDWSGIDLGLYGTWKEVSKSSPIRKFVQDGIVDNRMAAALYRRAKVNLNLYRQSIGWGKNAPRISHAVSLNPRAYELAACGAFHISDFRTEVHEVFGDLVPTFRTPAEAAAVLRFWLANDAGRARVAESLPACVAESSWVHRARTVIGDLEGLLQWRAA